MVQSASLDLPPPRAVAAGGGAQLLSTSDPAASMQPIAELAYPT